MKFKLFHLHSRELGIFLLSFIVFYLSLAQSLNVFDFFTYAKTLETSFSSGGINYVLSHSFYVYAWEQSPVWKGEGINRAFLYVLITYLYTYLLHMFSVNVEFALNLFSAIVVALSSVFVYKVSELYLNKSMASLSSVIYMFIPYIFFNGINASILSLQLLIGSAWLYFSLLAIRKRDRRKLLYSSFLFLADVLVHTGVVLLLFAQLYVIYKVAGKKILSVVIPLILVLLAVAYAFRIIALFNINPYSLTILKTAFSVLLFAWESVNGLSIAFAFCIFASVILITKRAIKKNADELDWLFLIAFIPTLYTLKFFHYVPIFNFNAMFVFLPLIFLRTFSTLKYFPVIIAISLLFMAMTDLMLYDQFHNYNHPNKDYSLWLQQKINGTVVVGHECSAARLYTTLEVLCLEDSPAYKPDIYVTSNYLKNINQIELEYMEKYFGVNVSGTLFNAQTTFAGKELAELYTFDGTRRSMEDHYQWLYSIYPDPLRAALLPKQFMQADYSVYQAK